MKRPDVQFVGSDGKVYIIEVGVSQSAKALDNMQELYSKALGDRFGGCRALKVE